MIIPKVLVRRLSSDPKRCPSCSGTGKDGRDKPCKACEGSGENSKVVWLEPMVEIHHSTQMTTSREEAAEKASLAAEDTKTS